MCLRPFRSAEQVDRHIDNCPGPQPTPPASYNLRQLRPAPIPTPYERPVLPALHPHIPPPPPPNSRAMTPLPKVNYAMYNDSKLRLLLSELGLSTYGNRSLLSARHKEFVNLHNSNIDRPHPQSRAELLRQLERWDATQQTLSRGEKRKDLDGKEWGIKCKDDFQELARRARETAKRRKVEKEVSKEQGAVVEGDGMNGEGPSAVISSQETVAL